MYICPFSNKECSVSCKYWKFNNISNINQNFLSTLIPIYITINEIYNYINPSFKNNKWLYWIFFISRNYQNISGKFSSNSNYAYNGRCTKLDKNGESK